MSTEIELLRRQNAALLAELRFWSSEHKHAGDCEFGEEGCYLCRNAEKEHYLKITKPLLANAGVNYVPRAELDALKRQNAAMREALERLQTIANDYVITDTPLSWDMLDTIRPALPPDAGAKLLTPEQVMPLVEALQGVLDSAVHPDIAMRSVMVPLEPIRSALAHARSLGL